MKLLVDIFACQSPSRFRGIGRYTHSLVSEMVKLRGNKEMVVLADALYPESFEELRQHFTRLLPGGSFLPYYHESLQNPKWRSTGPLSKIAETLIEQAYQVVDPDMVLTPSFFDGWGGWEQGMVPLPDKDFVSPKRAAILYDIIPYIFRERYLAPDPPIEEWYLERAELLKKFDLLLAISESTRQDAINLLGIQPDKVVNISGAASSQFRKLQLSEDEKRSWLQHFGISRPFVLYIGGNDIRKNMDGALRAFAHLPVRVRSSHQLFLNDVGDETVFRKRAHKLGLEDSDIVIARRTTDEELTVLYNLCTLFIFPSLYEGFGLPILEAMSCGAPVLAANNSSLPEVVGRQDALFDVSDDQAVIDKIAHVLTNDAFRQELAAYGSERVKQFSWENSARRAWEAIEIIQKEKKTLTHWDIPAPVSRNLRIAYVSPLPPQKSGISVYSGTLLPHLKPYFDIDLFVEPGLEVSDAFLTKNFSIHPWTELPERGDQYDAVIYHMGNSEFHIPMLRLLQDVPGIVVSHDFFMSNLPFVRAVRSGDRNIFFEEIDDSHGLRGLVDYVKNGIESARWTWPMNWKILKYAQEIIVHSEHQSELLNHYYAYGWKPRLKIIKHFRESVPVISIARKKTLRKQLGLDPKTFTYCSFGFMSPTKLNNPTIQAFSQIPAEIQNKSTLIFVGELEGGEYGLETLDIIKKLKLEKKVQITGYVSQRNYEKYLACADVAIQLRTDSRGETSGAILDCMAYGLPVITNAHGSMNDYSAEDMVKLPEEPGIEEIAEAMDHLQTDEAFRLEKGQRARTLILEEHDPEKIAAAYADVIITAARGKQQKLFAPLVDSILKLGTPEALLLSSARYAAANLALRGQARILVDMTGLETGLVQEDEQQKLSEIVKGLFASGNKALQVELIHEFEGSWLRACRLAEKIFELPNQSLGAEKPVIVHPGDILLLSNYPAWKSASVPGINEQIRQMGGKIISLVDGASAWLPGPASLESDLFLSSSQKCAEDVFAGLKILTKPAQRPLDILFPCFDKPGQEIVSDGLPDGYQMQAGEQFGRIRMVKIQNRAWNESTGLTQALIESGFIFMQGLELPDR